MKGPSRACKDVCVCIHVCIVCMYVPTCAVVALTKISVYNYYTQKKIRLYASVQALRTAFAKCLRLVERNV